jgi:hypothetical protein
LTSLGFRVAAHVYYLADAKALVAAGLDVLAHGVRDLPVDDELVQALKVHGTWYIRQPGAGHRRLGPHRGSVALRAAGAREDRGLCALTRLPHAANPSPVTRRR